MNRIKGSPVVRFDIGCKNSQQTQEFYSNVFGWKMTPAKHNTEVDTSSDAGIPGSITSLGHEPHQYIMIYGEVSSITAALKEIEANGGENHIGPLPTGNGHFFAWVKDPEGNQIGILSNKE